MGSSPIKYWIVGSAFKDRNEDQTNRFLSEGLWEIDSPSEADRLTVQTMRPGDRIAIKSTFVQKHGLPFNNHGQSVSVLRIKARGTVTDNPGNGERVGVAWELGYEGGDWYFFTYRGVIWLLPQGNEAADQLTPSACDPSISSFASCSDGLIGSGDIGDTMLEPYVSP